MTSTARVHWHKGQPVSARYDDVYFSTEDGLEETEYIFLQQNALAERWQTSPCQDTFYIGETGFGSGLNFLAAWRLWEKSAGANKRLHFLSVENEPLHKSDMARAAALWPELETFAQALLAVYPQTPMKGFHSFNFGGGRVQLTLIIDDATAGLKQLLASDHPLHRHPFHRGMDAWFLDGFAPAKNPAMWQAELFDIIAALSTEHTTLATFTAAGKVKRELQRAGFRTEKRQGYGKQREMLAARFAGRLETEAEDFPTNVRKSPYPAAWYVQPRPNEQGGTKAATVIGAGLAGSQTARALAERGWQVTVLDRADAVASGASGNAQGIVYGKLSSDTDGLALFNLASLLYAQRFYRPYWQAPAEFGEQCGLLQLAFNAKEERIQQKLENHFAGATDFLHRVDPTRASEIAGVDTSWPGVYFPQLGWLNPPALCRHLLDHPNITLQCKTAVSALAFSKTTSTWQLLDPQGEVIRQASNLVIANAHNALDYPETAHLPLKPIRGQVSCFRKEAIPLKTVLCSDGYIAPAASDQLQSFGATFTLHEQRPEVLSEDHRQNLAKLSATMPSLANILEDVAPAALSGRASFRCTTADYLPLVGPVPDYARFVATFAPLEKNARAPIASAGPYLPGLYLNVGHGSRGLAYTPLSAHLLAAQMDGDVLPLPRDLAAAVNPARFIIRDLIRSKLKP